MVNAPIYLIFIGLLREQPTCKYFGVCLGWVVFFLWTIIFIELTIVLGLWHCEFCGKEKIVSSPLDCPLIRV